MSEEAEFQRAFFRLESGSRRGERIEVHFNPASLQYTISNTLERTGSGNRTKQFVSQSNGKLVMDLVFDTTHDGQDVRAHTEKVAKLMEPEETIPAIVQFEWGTYTFQGMVESYRETLDFFAPNGVPLRASINLSLASQDRVFESGPHTARVDVQGALPAEPVSVAATAPGGASGVAAVAGNALAGRAIASANGLASMRVGASASLNVGASVSLRGPSAFASGGAGIGGGISVGAGASFGGRASAGVAAGAGAFGGLHTAVRGPGGAVSLNPSRLARPIATAGLATDRGASFRLGGQAGIEGSASLNADVGVSASLRPRILFGG